MNNRLQQAIFPQLSASRVISILSGKGGVGKSVLAIALAEQFAAMGKRVLLVDADFGCGNLHVLCNLTTGIGLKQFVLDQAELEDVTVEVRPNWRLLAGNDLGATEQLRTVSSAAALISRLNAEAGSFDRVIIDHGSGISDAATTIASGSDLSLVVVVPELTSISDGYGLCKYLLAQNKEMALSLVLNRCREQAEADDLTARFETLGSRFLKRIPSVVGWLPEDPVFRRSIARQLPPAELNSKSPAVQALNELARNLVGPSITSTLNLKQTINNAAPAADIRG